MEISWLQAILIGIFACLSSMPGMGGSSIGNYTLGRPLVGGLVCGLILGDVTTGVLVGCAMQVVYIALVTPGGTVSADVRAVSYIGIPLAMAALSSYGLDAASSEGTALATSFGTMVGTLGTVLFYGTATINLVWQHIGWKAVENRQYKKLYLVDMGLPWISHLLCSFIPTVIMCKLGADVVEMIKTALPMDGLAMKTLFTVGSLQKGDRFYPVPVRCSPCGFHGDQPCISNSDRRYVCDHYIQLKDASAEKERRCSRR